MYHRVSIKTSCARDHLVLSLEPNQYQLHDRVSHFDQRRVLYYINIGKLGSTYLRKE